ncbi:MAG TPA: putative nucleotide-diphospho-sugar transferase [Bacillota bacterium]|mgnify:CR=1 FL=1|nr:putative nucleotide-diphospho-sugar transferase [Bacillota bacterium]HPL52736.1 putative nucleotide-diphospho-sugar transferase [Bacillota bacterium]
MKILFCTISTKYRLHQCIALYNSIRRFLPEAILAVLCMDEDTRRLLNAAKLSGIRIVPLEALENKELMAVKEKRSLCEYCWTMKPALLQYLFGKYKEVEVILYLDADLYFFDNPEKLLSRKKRWNVLLTTHKVNKKANSGFIILRRTRVTDKILNWWYERCMEWCFSRNEKGKYGDQGYLNLLRKMFIGIRCLKISGINIAPWNFFNYDFIIEGGKLYVGRHRLIFFHFSGLRLRKSGVSTIIYGSEIPCSICSVYCRELRKAIDYIAGMDSEITENFYMGV